ncbi:DUF6262 family protein [Brevibacillus laterosporus]|uniref:DUF6262 family protein n=1 Tax=Brevibacillus laterosporus TaxID=1465 RepID=UPI0011299968|nr:DUF6262 family protein [Brevibacillus laterosporus]MBG9801523.1 transposase [Brevibacillus laterosporus]MED2006241.1 DUF6262 family protein [Brevibacillus laterosporus]MED4766236.1 DUF6262 family protein [Brevibacillus laterosporus]TPH19054.1 transposase [Brevibacillus laterosporus]
MANANPNINGILAHSRIKKEIAFQKVEEALKNMIKKQMKINFNSVSEESGVSKGFIYKNSILRDRIETLRRQQEGLLSPKQVKRNMSDSSKDVIIASLRNRIKELESENKKLKEQLKLDFAKIYERI